MNPGEQALRAATRHRPWKDIEEERDPWDSRVKFQWIQTKEPTWKFGQGASNKALHNRSVAIDPYETGRPTSHNYHLLTSAIVPRPVAMVSTISKDSDQPNLAPYSFFQMMTHDPPTFVIGHATGLGKMKDSLTNILETGECVINILTEDILEAGNACAVNAPPEMSEWSISGLSPAPCHVVKPSRIAEASFSVECKLVEHKRFANPSRPDDPTGFMTILQGLHFWVREDVVDKDLRTIDVAKSKPVGRMHGIGYARITQGFQIPWPSWEDAKEKIDGEEA